MAEREALAAAILSYDGPVDVSLPIHPAASETLRYRVEALADAILAALPDHVLISKEELERLRGIEAEREALPLTGAYGDLTICECGLGRSYCERRGEHPYRPRYYCNADDHAVRSDTLAEVEKAVGEVPVLYDEFVRLDDVRAAVLRVIEQLEQS